MSDWTVRPDNITEILAECRKQGVKTIRLCKMEGYGLLMVESVDFYNTAGISEVEEKP